MPIVLVNEKTAPDHSFPVETECTVRGNGLRISRFCNSEIWKLEGETKKLRILKQENGILRCPRKIAGITMTTNPREKAELLNKYFASVFTTDDGSSQSVPIRVSNGEGLSSVLFTSSKVLK